MYSFYEVMRFLIVVPTVQSRVEPFVPLLHSNFHLKIVVPTARAAFGFDPWIQKHGVRDYLGDSHLNGSLFFETPWWRAIGGRTKPELLQATVFCVCSAPFLRAFNVWKHIKNCVY